ncbi:hypothetical protein R5R35_001461 [Gryllus longicercus]|uniref:Lipase n=1 Tax=Gryllus longicercus TaxID=2509291 RepID=A0AAN9Z3J0_9ORTH
MQWARAALLWLAAWAGAWAGAAAQEPAFVPGVASLLGALRPAKAVVRAVRAAAPELFVNLTQRLSSWGYPLETHTVRTEDGYLLTVHRIPHGRAGANASAPAPAAGRPPVLLQHGIISCSEYWVLGGPDNAPALLLADQGYDVWLNNVRGNHYSRKHENLRRKDKEFWMFSWHEIGMYDIPAVIDYILNATQQEKLFYLSHSMGNTLFYVAMSLRPEYNAKIRLQVALAPAVYLNDTPSVPARLAIANSEYIKNLVETFPTYEILPKTESAIALNYFLCSDKAFFNKLCALLFSWIVGAVDLNNTTNLCLVLARSTSSTSALVPWHFAQISRSGEFTQMDLGRSRNMRSYGAPSPPAYPLHRVTAPAAIYVADGDFIVTAKGTERLSKILPNVVLHKVIREKFFNHMDFVTHPRVKELVMDHVLETMARF